MSNLTINYPSTNSSSSKLLELGIESIDSFMQKVKEFKFTNIQSECIPIHCQLASSFGNLDKESVKLIDDKLKILISATVRELEKVAQEELSWKKILSSFNQNSLMEVVEGSKVSNSDRLVKDRGISFFKFSGAPSPLIVEEVEQWFRKLLKDDQDVITDTKIDIDIFTDIVARSGALVTSLDTLIHKETYHEKKVVDIGIIRFPDFEHPYIKVYRIKLDAWSDGERVLFVQEDTNGILGEFNSIKYQPRESVIAELKEVTKHKAIEEAEALLN